MTTQSTATTVAGGIALAIGAIGALFGYLNRKTAATSDLSQQLFLRVSQLEKRDDEKNILIHQLQEALHAAERKIDKFETTIAARDETIRQLLEAKSREVMAERLLASEKSLVREETLNKVTAAAPVVPVVPVIPSPVKVEIVQPDN